MGRQSPKYSDERYRSVCMSFKVTFVGAQAHEHTPHLAVYAVNSAGRLTRKISVESEGHVDITASAGTVIAIGSNLEKPSSLDPKGLVTLRLADQLQLWSKAG